MMERTYTISQVRQMAGERGFFRACLGENNANAIVNGTMDDETALQLADEVSARITGALRKALDSTICTFQ